jgi:hypothetical protein
VAQFTLPLDPANGPVLTAFVGVSLARRDALMTAGRPIPAGASIRALIDTGASNSCIDAGVLASLGLTPTSSVTVHTSTTGAEAHTADQYDVSIIVPGTGSHHAPLVIPAVPVLSASLTRQGIDALIGRDILRDCILIYNGSLGMFTLAF